MLKVELEEGCEVIETRGKKRKIKVKDCVERAQVRRDSGTGNKSRGSVA